MSDSDTEPLHSRPQGQLGVDIFDIESVPDSEMAGLLDEDKHGAVTIPADINY